MRAYEIFEYRNNRIPRWEGLGPQELIKSIVDSTGDGRHLNAWIDAVRNVWRGEDNPYTRYFLTAYNTLKDSIDPAERKEYAKVLKYAHLHRITGDKLKQFKPSLFKLPTKSSTSNMVLDPDTDSDNDSELMRDLKRRQRMAQTVYGGDSEGNNTDSDSSESLGKKSAAQRILKWLPLTVYATVLAIMNDPDRAVQYLRMSWSEIWGRMQQGDPYAAVMLVANRVYQGNVSNDHDVDIPGGAKKASRT